MRKKILFVTCGLLLVASISAVVCIKNWKNSVGELFDANVEALTDYEILVGNLCMKTSNYACSSLGEVYLDHYPA